MKKKICAALLAIGMALTLCACGASSNKGYDSAASAPQENTSAAYDVKADEEEIAMDDVAAETEDMADAGAAEGSAGMTDESAAGSTAETSDKIIYTYNYSVETKTFDEFMDTLQQRVNEYGGYMESSEVNGNQEMNIRRYAYLVIRVPADKMHSFLEMVKNNSNVTYSSSSSENVTLSYVDLQSHIKALKVEQESLMALLERAETTEDIIAIQGQLTDVRYELEAYESQLRVYDNRINYSTLYLDINEVERESSVATELTYGEEIRQGLSDTLYDLGQGLRSFSIWFIVNLPVLLLWAVILVIIFLIVRALIKRSSKKKLEQEARWQRGIWSKKALKAEKSGAEVSDEAKEDIKS